MWVEWVAGDFDDPMAEIIQRVICETDAQDNVISAGIDTNLDAAAENVNFFTVANGDVVSITMADGMIYNYVFSDVLDTRNFLDRNTFGHQVAALLRAFTMSNGEIEYVKNAFFNKHVLQEALDSGAYVVNPNGYVQSRTWVEDYSGTDVNFTEEYTFQ